MQSPVQSGKPAASVPRGDGLCSALAVIANELSQVRLLIERQLSDCSEPVRGLVNYLNSGRGKMVRPALVLLSGLACGQIAEQHIRAAAVVEMIHNATLLHDDVVDEGKSRRGVPTLNSLEGNESAVLLGDLVLSRVFQMCVGLNRRAAEAIASAAVRTCEGELRQILQKGNCRLDESEYIDIIAQKSAALFSAACLLGAMLANADEARVQMLAGYGRNLGIAFQITDDLLDLVGDAEKTGKCVGSDLDRNKLTLPLIHLLRTAGVADRRLAEQILSHQPAKNECNPETGYDRSVLLEKLKACGSIDYARRQAEAFVEQAITGLAGLGNSSGKEALVGAARFVAARTA